MNEKRPIHLIILAAAVVFLYANILPNPFIWDDNIFILQNQFVRDWKNAPLLFQSEFFSKSPLESTFESGGYYRPLVMLFYTLEYHLWGESPQFYRLTSILLHLLNVFLVYFLIQRLFQNRSISFIGALLFASHPLHTETVSYLPSRGDLWVSFFCLASFLLSLSPKGSYRSISLLSFLFALLSKESAMIFPALLFVHAFCDRIPKTRRIFFQFPFWIILAFYVALRLFAFPFLSNPPFVDESDLVFRILSLGKLILSYCLLLIFSYPLHLERSAPLQTGFREMGTVVFIGMVLGLIWLGRFLWRKNRSLFFGWMWFLIALVPVSNIIPLSPSMAEHYLYFPSIGFLAVIAFVLYQLFVRVRKGALRKLFLFLGILVWMFCGALVIKRNRDYSDEIRLYVHTTRHSPQSARVHNNLGSVYFSRGLLEEAKRAFERSLSLDPNQPLALANLGTLYRENKEYDKAILFLKKALAQEKGYAAIWNKLGIAYAEKGSEEAVGAFLEAIQKDPDFVDAYFNLGSYYWRKGELEKCASFWEEGRKRNPNHPELTRWVPLLNKKLFNEAETYGTK